MYLIKLAQFITLLILVSSLSVFAAQDQEAKEMSLQEAIFLSLRYNPDVQVAEINRVVEKFNLYVVQNQYELQYRLSASFDASTSRSNGLSSSTRNGAVTPEVSKLGSYGTRYSLTMNNPVTKGTYNPGVELSVSQPLLRGFGKEITLAPYYNAEDQEFSNRLQFKGTVMSIVQQVITSYRQLILDQNNVETSELSLKNYAEAIKSDNALIKVGRKAPTEVLTAESSYASEEVNLQDSKIQVISDTLQLLNIIGLSPDIKVKVPNNVSKVTEDFPSLDEAIDIALQNNPQYLQSLLDLQVAKRRLLVAMDDARTALDMTVSASSGNGSGTGGDSGLRSLTNNRNSSLGVRLELDIPIQDYELEQNIVSSKAELEQAEIQLNAAQRILRTLITNDHANVVSDLQQIRLAEKALELQNKNQEYLNAKLKYGLVSTFEVTTRQQDLNNARIQVIQSKITYLNDLTSLYFDMGVLLEQWDIELIY